MLLRVSTPAHGPDQGPRTKGSCKKGRVKQGIPRFIPHSEQGAEQYNKLNSNPREGSTPTRTLIEPQRGKVRFVEDESIDDRLISDRSQHSLLVRHAAKGSHTRAKGHVFMGRRQLKICITQRRQSEAALVATMANAMVEMGALSLYDNRDGFTPKNSKYYTCSAQANSSVEVICHFVPPGGVVPALQVRSPLLPRRY